MKNVKRFTLTDGLIVVAIICIFAAVAIPPLVIPTHQQSSGAPFSKEQQIASANFVYYKGEPYLVQGVNAAGGTVELQGNGNPLIVPANEVHVQ